MGSAAFLMVEFLEIPLKNVILAAIIPAAMHFLGVLTGSLRSQTAGTSCLRDEIPKLRKALFEGG